MCRRRPERSRAWPRPCASLRPRGRRSSIWRAKRDPVAPAAPAVELPAHVLTLPSLFRGPAYLLDHAWTARAWNGAASRLFVGWLDDKSHDRNLLRFVFLSPTARALLTDWPERARRLVAEFRADYSRRPRDAGMQSLVSELSESSRLFRSLWRRRRSSTGRAASGPSTSQWTARVNFCKRRYCPRLIRSANSCASRRSHRKSGYGRGHSVLQKELLPSSCGLR
jgi:hypothetical protein